MDSGEGFMNWEIERGLLAPEAASWIKARYREYKEGRVGEERMCGEMVTIHKGLRRDDLEMAADRFVKERVSRQFFPEMLTLVRQLGQAGCEIWAVSSTNDWVVRAGVAQFGIAPERVLGACVHMEDGVATDRLDRVPSGPDKAVAVREVIRRTPDAAFGNSIHDRELLECAQRQFAINPNPDLKELALSRAWKIYQPAPLT
jgi:phosphoserine phosphatase